MHIKLRDYQINLINDVAKHGELDKALYSFAAEVVIHHSSRHDEGTTDNNKMFCWCIKELCEQIENTFTDYGVNMI